MRRRVAVLLVIAAAAGAAGYAIAQAAGSSPLSPRRAAPSLASQISRAVAKGIENGLGETSTTATTYTPPVYRCPHLMAAWNDDDPTGSVQAGPASTADRFLSQLAATEGQDPPDLTRGLAQALTQARAGFAADEFGSSNPGVDALNVIVGRCSPA